MPKQAKKRTPFAKNLTIARKAKGISQRELAHLVDVSPRVIGLYETVIKNPTPEIVIRIASALRVTTDELLGHKPIKDTDETSRRIFKAIRKLESFSPKDQKIVLDYINLLDAKVARGQ